MKWDSIYIIVGVVVWLVTFRIVFVNNDEEYSTDPTENIMIRLAIAAVFAAEMALCWPIILGAGIIAAVLAAGMYIDEMITEYIDGIYE